ncbi:catechol [Diaporthe eres]|nr:catechol [Diaporthe eres]
MAPNTAANSGPLVAKDLNIDNITDNVIAFCSQGRDPRMKFVFERLVSHIHDFARETRLSTDEWREGLDWLQACGQICNQNRKKENGEQLSHDPNGEPLFVLCTIRDTRGNPIAGAQVHVWEADSNGAYDVEKPDSGVDGRGILHSDDQGRFYFDAIVPVPYPILCDGPVGAFLAAAGRHEYRPAHMHFMFEKKGYDHLITALYLRNSKYRDTDAVFGVKESLVIDVGEMDSETAATYNRHHVKKLLKYDFVLASDVEADELRDKQTAAAFTSLKRRAIPPVTAKI